jgi:hypothetical protein
VPSGFPGASEIVCKGVERLRRRDAAAAANVRAESCGPCAERCSAAQVQTAAGASEIVRRSAERLRGRDGVGDRCCAQEIASAPRVAAARRGC